MDIKFSNDLFLGLVELNHFKDSLKTNGFERLFKQTITSYGIVNASLDTQFDALKVISAGPGQVTVKNGVAVDSDANVIQVDNNEQDILDITDDSITRYLVLSYAQTVIEEGTVNIGSDGVLTGISTEFTSRLSGNSGFPSKISFPESLLNTREYEIQAIQSDTQCSLNIAQGTIIAESDVKYSIVGTFTPGITIQQENKYPLISDGYVLELRLSSTVVDQKEFILAEVSYDGSNLSIKDRRQDAIFSVENQSRLKITNQNDIIGVESIKFNNIGGLKTNNLVTIGWGLLGSSGTWSVDNQQQQLILSNANGGVYSSITDIEDEELVGWKAVFKDGQVVGSIISCVVSNNQLILGLDAIREYPNSGDVFIVPDCDLIELTISNATNATGDSVRVFSSKSRKAIIPLLAGSESTISFRHIKEDMTSSISTLNDGSYINESSFNDNGILQTSEIETTAYTQGKITPRVNSTFSSQLLDSILPAGMIIDWYRGESDVPEGFIICDGRLIEYEGSIYNGLNAPNLSGKVSVGFNSNDSSFDSLGKTGGTNEYSLTKNQLPAVKIGGSTITQGTHSHQIPSDPSKSASDVDTTVGEWGGYENNTNPVTISSQGGHQHDIETDELGNGDIIDNKQEYFTVYKIMKL